MVQYSMKMYQIVTTRLNNLQYHSLLRLNSINELMLHNMFWDSSWQKPLCMINIEVCFVVFYHRNWPAAKTRNSPIVECEANNTLIKYIY